MDPREPLAEHHRVVGERYAHGISAWRRVPPSGWALELEVAVEGMDTVGEPAQAGAARWVGASRPVIGHVDDDAPVEDGDADLNVRGPVMVNVDNTHVAQYELEAAAKTAFCSG